MDIALTRIIEELQAQQKKKNELTEHLGMVNSAFGHWVSGRNKSYLKYLHSIADFLNVPVEYLRGETDQKEKPSTENDERLHELYKMTEGLNEAEILALKSFVAGLKANRQQD